MSTQRSAFVFVAALTRRFSAALGVATALIVTTLLSVSALPAAAAPSRGIPLVSTSRSLAKDPCITAPIDRCEAWTARFGSHPANTLDQPVDVALDPASDTVFVTGQTYDAKSSGWDITTVAFRSRDGKLLWHTRLRGKASDEPSAIAVSRDGKHVYVTGQRLSNLHAQCPNEGGSHHCGEVLTVAYDARRGKRLWASTFGGQRSDGTWGTDLAASPLDGTIYVIGGSYRKRDSGSTDPDYLTIAYDADTGRTRWVRGYDGSVHGADHGIAIAIDSRGKRIFITGSSESRPRWDYDFMTLALSASGERLWASRLDGGYCEITPVGVAVSNNGMHVYVAGSVMSSAAGSGYCPGTADRYETAFGVASYSARSGQKQWSSDHAGIPGAEHFASSMALAPQGDRIFVTGRVQTAPPTSLSTDWVSLTAAFDTQDGGFIWEARDQQRGFGEHLAAGDLLFLAATQENGNTTLSAFEPATGARVWSASHESHAPAGVVASKGSVHVLTQISSFEPCVPPCLPDNVIIPPTLGKSDDDLGVLTYDGK